MGVTGEGELIDDIKLPPWASSVHEFVHKHREVSGPLLHMHTCMHTLHMHAHITHAHMHAHVAIQVSQ